MFESKLNIYHIQKQLREKYFDFEKYFEKVFQSR